MKISCTPISFSSMFSKKEITLEKFIEYCAEQGLDAIDLMDPQYYPWQWQDFETQKKTVGKLLEKAGLKLAAFACGNQFTPPDENEFNAHVEKVKKAIQTAADFGAPLIRIFGGYHSNPGAGGKMPHAAALERVLLGIEKCLPCAEKYGVALALENHGCMPGHSYEIEKIIKKFTSPFLRCTFDCANFMANNMDETEDPLRAYERLKRFVGHVHFKDFAVAPADSGKRVAASVAGKGIVPLRQFAAMLEDDGYPGYCSLEYEAAVPAMEGVPESFAYMKEIRKIQALFK